jgi:hypothetical protein
MAGERMPTVLMTADTVGGVWTYAAELARELDARGVDVAPRHHGRAVRSTSASNSPAAPASRCSKATTEARMDAGLRDDVDARGRWLLELERACSRTWCT